MCVIGKKIYMFGGYAKEPFCDVRSFIEEDNHWSGQIFENKGEEGIDHPKRRFGHIMCTYRQNFVIFGGAGLYN